MVRTVIQLQVEVEAQDNYGPEWTLADVKKDSKNKAMAIISQIHDKMNRLRVKGEPTFRYYIAEEED